MPYPSKKEGISMRFQEIMKIILGNIKQYYIYKIIKPMKINEI